MKTHHPELEQTGPQSLACLVACCVLVAAVNAEATSRVFAWGNNSSGQCAVPPGLTDPVAVAAGVYHSLALRRDGTVVAWGRNTHGQINVPVGLTNVMALAAGQYHSLALTADGRVVAWGSYVATNVPAGLSNVVALASGVNHGLALQASGHVTAWGLGSRTNVPGWLSNVVAIAGGASHSLALRADGTLVGWGTDSHGLTNPPAGLHDVVAIASGYLHNVALKADGTVTAWGDNSRGQTNVPAGLSGVIALGAGGYHTLALCQDGTIVAWGWNSDGQLNAPGGLANLVALAGGERHTLALEGDGAPHFTVQPWDRRISIGATVSFHAWAAGAPPISYQWFCEGTALDGATDPTLTLPGVQVSDTGRYECVASNAVGVAVSRTALLEVTECPSITQPPSSQTVFAGSRVTFSAVAAGAPPLTYQWLRAGAAIVGSNTATLVIEAARPSDTGAYSLLVSNACGSATSVPALLTVNDRLPLLRLTNVWKYDQSGLDLGIAWKETNYNDAAWSQGAGVLAVENLPDITPLIRTTLVLSNAARERIITYYFRTHFTFSEDPTIVYLTATNLVDDGAVVYLNGQEVYRLNMAAGPVRATSLAMDPVEASFVPIHFPGTHLVRGDNLLAVEVHQVSTTSSDVVFGLSLDAQFEDIGPATIVVQPQGRPVPPEANVQLSVVAAGDKPLSYQWQKGGTNLVEDARIQGVTTRRLSITSVEPGDVGDYYVVVQNAHGSTLSEPAGLWLPPPPFRWTESAGGSGIEWTHDAAVDRWGNVYVAGSFSGAFNWGNTNVTSRGGLDACLMKYSPNGLLLWVQTVGGSGDDDGGGVATDAEGNCYLSGQYSETATFGTTSLPSAGSYDAFLTKFTPEGTLLWVRRGGGSGTDRCWSVAGDESGGCYISGAFSGTATFGSQTFTSAGSYDLYLARYDANGNFQWAVRGGGTGEDYGAQVATDPQGAAYVTGWFTGSATFSGRSVTSAGDADMLVAKYSSNGTLLWVQTAGTTTTDLGKSIAADTNGNSYVLAILYANRPRAPRLRVAKYNADGLLQWEREEPGRFYWGHCSIATDSGGCYVTGGFEDTATFGQATLISAGDRDVFLASYDAQGVLQWVERAGGATADFGAGIAASPTHGVYLCGWFTGDASFGPAVLTSHGSQDLFVARLGYRFDPARFQFDPAHLGASAGEFRLRLRGLTGARSVVLVASTNLVSWEPILTNSLPHDPLDITIPTAPDWPRRFFRAIVPEESSSAR